MAMSAFCSDEEAEWYSTLAYARLIARGVRFGAAVPISRATPRGMEHFRVGDEMTHLGANELARLFMLRFGCIYPLHMVRKATNVEVN